MKILWFTEFYPTSEKSIIGGVQSRCYYVSKYLSPSNDLRIFDSVPQVWARPSIWSFTLRLVYFFINIFKSLTIEFDVVESSNSACHLQAWIVGRIKKKPVIFWVPDVFIGSWFKKFGVVGIFGEIVERLILFLGADKYIAISNEVKLKLVANGVAKNKIEVIYCGVDHDLLLNIKSAKLSKEFDVVAVSRLQPYKRIDLLIEALAKINNKGRGIKALILGDGPDRSKIERLIKTNNLKDSVKLLSHVESHNDVLRLISRSKVLCHPSVVEGFGIVLIEAIFLGVPYVASDIPIVREVTHNGLGGLLFESNNSSDLADKLINILQNEKRPTNDNKEIEELSKLYSWKEIAKKTEDIYKITSL